MEHQYFCIPFFKNPEGKTNLWLDRNWKSVFALSPNSVPSSLLWCTGLAPLFLYDHISYYKGGKREGNNIMVNFRKLTLDQWKKSFWQAAWPKTLKNTSAALC